MFSLFTFYTPDKPHRATGQSLLYRDSLISPFPPTQRTPWTSHGPTTIQNRMDRQVLVPALLSQSAAGQEPCGWITGEPPAYLHSGYINLLGKDVPLMNWSIVQWTDQNRKSLPLKVKQPQAQHKVNRLSTSYQVLCPNHSSS